MSSGAGMTAGLLRKAGTGPGRLTLPGEETQVEMSLISIRIYDNDLAYRCTAQVYHAVFFPSEEAHGHICLLLKQPF